MARLYTANVMASTAGGRRLWQLSTSGDKFVLHGEKALLPSERVPAGAAGKDWKTLFRGKLNVAWLPASRVFLRALHLPASEPGEIVQMVELQLEKLSPLPVTQIVWSVHLLPRPADKPDALQTVIVMIASRGAVEEFLGQLEGSGFLADRLEAPGLDQLLSAGIREEGVWIFPGAEDEPVLVAWWYGGTLQNLSIVALPPGPERGLQLKTQLQQLAWAGELEGWLTSPPKIHLVAGRDDAKYWEPVLKDAGEEVPVIALVPADQLASLCARRCAADPKGGSLLPPEFALRYRQQFVDGLWMRGLMTVFSAYVIGVLIYFGALYVLKLKATRVRQDLSGLSAGFVAAQKDREQLRIVKARQELKYKALDCWKTLAESLPDGVTIEGIYFSRGAFKLHGTADDPASILAFNQALRVAPLPGHDDETLFSEVTQPNMQSRPNNSTEWRFDCAMKEEANE